MMGGWGNIMGGYGYGYGPWYGNGSFWWMGIIGMVVHLLFWVAIILLGIRLFRRYGNNGKNLHRSSSNSALEILRERYAKGEIDTEEFNRRKEDLMRSN